MASPLAVLAERGQRFIAESDPVGLLDMACRRSARNGAALAIAAIFDELSARPASVLTSGCDREWIEHLRSAEVPAAFREAARGGRVIREAAGGHARVGLPASHPPLTGIMIAPLASSSHVHGSWPWRPSVPRHSATAMNSSPACSPASPACVPKMRC